VNNTMPKRATRVLCVLAAMCFFALFPTLCFATLVCTASMDDFHFEPVAPSSTLATSPKATTIATVVCEGGVPQSLIPFQLTLAFPESSDSGVMQSTLRGGASKVRYVVTVVGGTRGTIPLNLSGRGSTRVRLNAVVELRDVLNAIPGAYRDSLNVAVKY